MAIDFPASPTNGQTFVVGTVTYTYDGTKWTAVAAGGGGGGSGDKIQEGNTSAEVIDTGSDGRFVVTTEGTERLRVTDAGLVGLGTNAPNSYVGGGNDFVIAKSGNAGLTIATGASSTGTINFADDTSGDARYRGRIEYSHTDDALDILTAAQTRMRIGSSGDVLIGGTLPASPKTSLKANGDATFTEVLTSAGEFFSSPVGNRSGITLTGSVATNANAFRVMPGAFPSPESINFKWNGDATFTGTVTATVTPPSDARFKENITPANPQLADVVALGKQLKNFNWNDEAPLNDELRAVRQLGLIAQEAEKVSPGIVKTIKRTKQGVEDSFKGISHDALIMKLLGAVAELSAEVEALKAAK